jgi:hypothetical protein
MTRSRVMQSRVLVLQLVSFVCSKLSSSSSSSSTDYSLLVTLAAGNMHA